MSGEIFEIEHLSGHHFVLTIELQPSASGTQVLWRQTFDTVAHYERMAGFVAGANEQNLQRLASLRSCAHAMPPDCSQTASRHAGLEGNLRFPLHEALPLDLIERLTKLRVKRDLSINGASRRKTRT